MPSEFDTFAQEFAAGSLMEHFGDSGDGEKPAVIYYPPGGGEGVAVVAIIGALEIADDFEETEGSHQRDEQRQEAKLKIQQPFIAHKNGRFSIAKYGEPDFSVKEISSITDAFVTVVVQRSLVERLQRRGMG